MPLLDTLTQDLKNSMLAGDTERTALIRLLRSALKNEEIKLGRPLGEDEALKVLQREAKQRRDSAEQYRQAGRPELAEAEDAERTRIEGYLPQPLSEEELGTLIDQVVEQTGAGDISQMGRVVGEVMKRAGARVEGARVSAAVKGRLAGQ